MDGAFDTGSATASRARPSITRTLGPVAVLFLTLSAATPASSVFAIVPGVLHVAGTGALLAMLLGALVCIGTAFIYAELSSAWPVAGGEYVMVERTMGPLAGFVVLGLNAVNNVLFLPVVALGVADVLATFWPAIPAVPVAIVVIVLSTLVSIFDIRFNAILTGAFLAIELLVLGIVALLGLQAPVRGVAALLLHPVAAGGPVTLAQIGVATTIAIFAFNGYGLAVYFGEDLHDAPRRIARVILLSFVLIFAAEVVPLAAILVGTHDLAAVLTGADPFGAFARARGGAVLGNWMAAGVALAMVNAAIVTVLACARFFFSTGRDGCWGRPIDRLMCAIHPRYGSPWAGTLLVGAMGVGLCFVPLPLLLVCSGGELVVIYAAIALAALAGRHRGTSAHTLYRMPAFPLIPVVTLVALVGVAIVNAGDPEAGRPGLLSTGAVMILSAAYYWVVLRRRPGGWTVVDPTPDDR
ncbi:APC family permease [Sphingomonas sp. PAMC 26617]|uniref:APC family permease n=1 Tax=Sphingomonas sp. PAMC 26617 TaxID=1112216 RepID=UPI000289994C|nr:APC family permease [Sphingomonas sp. PAMC 26617]